MVESTFAEAASGRTRRFHGGVAARRADLMTAGERSARRNRQNPNEASPSVPFLEQMRNSDTPKSRMALGGGIAFLSKSSESRSSSKRAGNSGATD